MQPKQIESIQVIEDRAYLKVHQRLFVVAQVQTQCVWRKKVRYLCNTIEHTISRVSRAHTIKVEAAVLACG